MIELTLMNKMAAYMVAPMSCKKICTTDLIFIHVLIYIQVRVSISLCFARRALSAIGHRCNYHQPLFYCTSQFAPILFFGPSLWKTMQPAWHMSDFHCQWRIMSTGSSCLHFFRIGDVVTSNPNYCHACYFGQNEKLKRKIC